MNRIRWANVARLVFALGAMALLVHGLPQPGGEPPQPPALGLPDGVLRPSPRRAPRPERPAPPLRRAPARGARAQRAPAPVRSHRPGRPSAAGPHLRPVAPPAPPTPSAPPPPVGEFGP